MSTRSGTAPREIYASFLCLLPERERSRRPSDKPSQHTASHALASAAAMAANGPLAVRQAKKSIHWGLQGDLLTGCRFEIEAYNRLVSSDDRHEGVRAFNEKRAPDFKGR